MCACALLAVMLGTATAEPQRVLLLHSFGREFEPWRSISATVREELPKRSQIPIGLYETSLETARFKETQDEGPFADYLRALFARRKLDLIVAFGGPATSFSQRNRQQLFPATPMLISATDQRIIDTGAMTPNDAAVGVTIDTDQLVDNILRVLPETTNIAVVTGSSPLEKYWTTELHRQFRPFEERVHFIWLTDLPFDEMLKRAAGLPPKSAILYADFEVDADGVPHEQDQVLSELHAKGNAPIFSHIDNYLGRGIVGGPLLSVSAISGRTVEVAIRILGGETPGDIKTPPIGMATPVFDWRELRRWDISEARLPLGSVVKYHVPSAWEQYGWQITWLAVAFCLQTLIITGLFYERQRRRKAEAFARQTMSDLARMDRIATAGELSASIAHEVNQPLTSLVLKANAAVRLLAGDTPDIGRVRGVLSEIASAGHHASDIVASIRAMFKNDANERKPIDINNLIATVLDIVRVYLLKNDVVLKLGLDEQLPNVEVDRVQLQQVLLNLVMNAIEAMQSLQPRVLKVQSERSRPDTVHVAIEDTGVGIDPSNHDRIFAPLFTTKARGMGMGLSICRSIIERHSGRIWVSPGLKRGTIFHFELPAKVDKD